MILTSMGHWIELMKVGTSAETVFKVVEEYYGNKKAALLRSKYLKLSQRDQKEFVTSQAIELIQNQAPCLNMDRKKKKP